MADYLPVTDQQRRSRMHHTTPSIFPGIPKDLNARKALQANLGKIGLGSRLLNFPWSITNADMVNELTGAQRVPEEVRHLECRAALYRFSIRNVEEIYDTKSEGEERPSDSRKEHLRYFKEQREGADGYQIIWPILDPVCPGLVHVFRFNQVYLALRRHVRVNWTRNIFRSLNICAQQVGVSPNSYLSPFLFHFYDHKSVLTKGEKHYYVEALERVQEQLAQGRTLDETAPELDSLNQMGQQLQPVERGYSLGTAGPVRVDPPCESSRQGEFRSTSPERPSP
jgi:hypothetical protein